jgi:transcriptional regulator with XRE-family HTH domain
MPEPKPPFKSVGDFIRTQRELMSLSMRQLAELAKVSNPYLSQIERGVYKPSANVLKGIADALDMSAETLYREAGLLDDSVERPVLTVEDAIRVDTRLTQEAKQALLQVYRGLIAAQQPSADRATPPRPAADGATPSRPARKTAAKAAPFKTAPSNTAPSTRKAKSR